MMAKIVKETATSAQSGTKGQWETQTTEQQHTKQLRFYPGLWARKHCGQAHPRCWATLCTQESPFTVGEDRHEMAFTVLPFQP